VIGLQIILNKKPKSPIIIHGFPGFGLVGTIASEFLIEHLKVEQIGKLIIEDIPPMVAIHGDKMVDPFGIFYDKKSNIVIVHAIASIQGFEWRLADAVIELAEKMDAKEIICIEGVAGNNPDEFKTFFFSKDRKTSEKFKKAGIEALKEGIIIGVTGAMLVKGGKLPLNCLFSETHTNLPDSKAAAKIIESLDKYLGLNVDYAPLMKQAESFEQKLQDLMKKSQESVELSEKKRMSYVG
jgi:uncharacterized protein